MFPINFVEVARHELGGCFSKYSKQPLFKKSLVDEILDLGIIRLYL